MKFFATLFLILKNWNDLKVYKLENELIYYTMLVHYSIFPKMKINGQKIHISTTCITFTNIKTNIMIKLWTLTL